MKSCLYIVNSRKFSSKMMNSLEPYTIGSFVYAPMKVVIKMGYNVFYGINRKNAEKIECTNFPVHFYNANMYRDVFAIKDNWIAYRNLVKFLKKHPEVEVIHCSTPIGGLLGRICGREFNKTVIYTVHGFHFYKGAPVIRNVVYKTIERCLACLTDCIITINQEDYEAAQRFRLHKGGKVYKVNGVGMDMNAYNGIKVDKSEKRKTLNVPENAIVGVVVGDLNKNKNVGTVVRALAKTATNIHVLICGVGPMEASLKSLAKRLHVENRCHFLGYRSDIKEIYLVVDMFISASQREGLPRSIMEAMLAGLPCIVSNIRGNVDLIDENEGGKLIIPKDYNSYAEAMTLLALDSYRGHQYGAYNKEKIKQFSLEEVEKQIRNVYNEICK